MKTFENTKNLLKKFIEGVKKDYNNHLEQFITSLSIMTKEDLEEDIQYILDDIPLTSTVLSWVKTNIIDYGEILLNKYRYKDTDKNEAIYYVNKEDLAILMKSNFIRTVEINIIMHYININTLNYMSIDLGVDNFAAIVSNTGIATIINGKGLKSVNKYYNKLIAKNKSLFDKSGNKGYSHLLYSITNKRNDKINYFMNIVSNYVIDLAIKNNISKIIIGKNEGWKQKCKLGKVTNQTFIQIPYTLFIQKLQYKCEILGIEIITIDEAYTSGTSFLDNELPIKENYNKLRRIYRGLFKSNSNKLINADINAACQIMRKVFVDAFIGVDDIGFVTHPVRVNLTF